MTLQQIISALSSTFSEQPNWNTALKILEHLSYIEQNIEDITQKVGKQDSVTNPSNQLSLCLKDFNSPKAAKENLLNLVNEVQNALEKLLADPDDLIKKRLLETFLDKIILSDNGSIEDCLRPALTYYYICQCSNNKDFDITALITELFPSFKFSQEKNILIAYQEIISSYEYYLGKRYIHYNGKIQALTKEIVIDCLKNKEEFSFLKDNIKDQFQKISAAFKKPTLDIKSGMVCYNFSTEEEAKAFIFWIQQQKELGHCDTNFYHEKNQNQYNVSLNISAYKKLTNDQTYNNFIKQNKIPKKNHSLISNYTFNNKTEEDLICLIEASESETIKNAVTSFYLSDPDDVFSHRRRILTWLDHNHHNALLKLIELHPDIMNELFLKNPNLGVSLIAILGKLEHIDFDLITKKINPETWKALFLIKDEDSKSSGTYLLGKALPPDKLEKALTKANLTEDHIQEALDLNSRKTKDIFFRPLHFFFNTNPSLTSLFSSLPSNSFKLMLLNLSEKKLTAMFNNDYKRKNYSSADRDILNFLTDKDFGASTDNVKKLLNASKVFHHILIPTLVKEILLMNLNNDALVDPNKPSPLDKKIIMDAILIHPRILTLSEVTFFAEQSFINYRNLKKEYLQQLLLHYEAIPRSKRPTSSPIIEKLKKAYQIADESIFKEKVNQLVAEYFRPTTSKKNPAINQMLFCLLPFTSDSKNKKLFAYQKSIQFSDDKNIIYMSSGELVNINNITNNDDIIKLKNNIWQHGIASYCDFYKLRQLNNPHLNFLLNRLSKQACLFRGTGKKEAPNQEKIPVVENAFKDGTAHIKINTPGRWSEFFKMLKDYNFRPKLRLKKSNATHKYIHKTGEIVVYDKKQKKENPTHEDMKKNSFTRISKKLHTPLFGWKDPKKILVGIVATGESKAWLLEDKHTHACDWKGSKESVEQYAKVIRGINITDENQFIERIDSDSTKINEVLLKTRREKILAIVIGRDTPKAREIARARKQKLATIKMELPIYFYDSNLKEIRLYEEYEQTDDERALRLNRPYYALHEESSKGNLLNIKNQLENQALMVNGLFGGKKYGHKRMPATEYKILMKINKALHKEEKGTIVSWASLEKQIQTTLIKGTHKKYLRAPESSEFREKILNDYFKPKLN